MSSPIGMVKALFKMALFASMFSTCLSCCNKFGLNPNRAFIMSDPNATFSEPTSVAYSAFDATVSRTAYNFELTLKADERTTLAAFQWKSKDRGDVRAMALISHGYAEYLTEDYDRLATFLAADGILVAAHDHLGHGRSDGPQAQTMVDFDTDYVVPIVEHTKHMQAEYPGAPVFLVGHSLGGLMAVLAVGREKEMFKGVVLVSPAVAIDPELATPFAVFMANVLGSILPGMPLNKIPLKHVTRDEKAVEKMAKDKLRYLGGGKAKNVKAALGAMKAAEDISASIETPMLVQQAEGDKIVKVAGVKAWMETVPAKDKEYIEYPEAFHNLLMELPETRDAFMADMKKWINNRI